jgi:hypothetical protein
LTQSLYDHEMEAAVLGAILINPDAYTSLSHYLTENDFHDIRHQVIWKALDSLRAQELPIDYLIVINKLQEDGRLQEAGGDAYLTSLLNSPVTSNNAEHYGRKVKEYSLRRRKLEAATRQAQEAVNFNCRIDLDEVINLRPRFEVRTAADALKPQAPLEWIVDRIISKGSVNIFYGDPGAKKTYALLSMAICIATGKPWLGMDVIPCKVLYIDEETGEKRLSLRMAAALRGELAGEDTPIEFICLAGFKLDDLNDIVVLKSIIQERGAGVIILDALADVMTGDENSKQDTQPIFNRLRMIAEETGTAIIIIHHSNKLGGYRGSSAIKGAVDLMILIESKNGNDYIDFTSEKNRDGEAFKWAAKAAWLMDPERFHLTAREPLEKLKPLPPSQDGVIRYLKGHGPAKMSVIMGAADMCEPGTAKKAVYALVQSGKVYRTNPDEQGQGVEAVYDLVKVETNNGLV